MCETMERLASLPFVAQPGEEWVYGYNTDILGCVVERASGLPLDEFIRDAHHRPARHERHAVLPAGREADRLVDGLRERADEHGRSRARRRARAGPLRGRAATQLRRRRRAASTARDYARFLEMIRGGGALGGVRLLSPRTVALMTHNQSGSLHGSDLGFGLGSRPPSASAETASTRSARSGGVAPTARLPSGSVSAPGHGAHDQPDSQRDRHPVQVPGGGAPGHRLLRQTCDG